MRKDILKRKSEILQWINENKTKAQISSLLYCKQETLNRYLKLMGIEYKGNQAGKGLNKNKPKTTLQEYLDTSIDIQTSKIHKKLLDEHIKEHKCENCGNTTWLDNPIPLEVHHKDGNRHNNTIENFVLLCPNCHALTDSYRGKNCRKGCA